MGITLAGSISNMKYVNVEEEFTVPTHPEFIEGYKMIVTQASDNSGWLGRIVTPNGESITVSHVYESGQNWYDKKSPAYRRFEADAKAAYPMDSCAIDNLSYRLLTEAEAIR